MDLLADVLAVSGVRGTVASRVEAGAAWGWWAHDLPGAAFHAVTSGTLWLSLRNQPPIQLMPGDVVLLPLGSEHSLSSDPGSVPRPGDPNTDWSRSDGGIVRIGSGPVQTHVLCAHYRHDPAVSTQILTLLPEVIHIRADHGGSCLSDTVRLLARELAHPQIATERVLNSLVDILLIQLLRVWLETQPVLEGTWLGVLGDPMISNALTKLHQNPAHDWTTATLAAEIHVSRATLSRRFPAVVGQTPAAYLTRWRMDLAALKLRDTDDTLEAIAESVGYTSVYAFSRAFRRAHAEPPGRYRVTSRTQAKRNTYQRDHAVARGVANPVLEWPS